MDYEKNPVFSVIVPVYNVQDYIMECVESVLKQQYKEYELLLIDDGSSDDSGKICDEYALANKNIKVIHKKNGGAASARNEGIKLASGEWILFLDSDDYYRSSDFFMKLCKKIKDISTQLIYYGAIELRDADNLLLRKMGFSNTFKYEEMSEDEKLEKFVLGGLFSIASWQYVIKTSFLRQNELFFNESYKREEDIEWIIRVFLANPKFAIMKSFPYIYRVRSGSVCTKQRKTCFWKMRFKAVEQSLKNIENSLCNEKRKKILYQELAYIYYILLAEIVDEPDVILYKKTLKKMKRFNHLRIYKGSRKTNLSRFIVNLAGLNLGARILNCYLHYCGIRRGQPIRIEKKDR